MKDCNAVDLPNYGVIEGQLEQEDLDYVWKLIHKYAPKSEWEGNRLLSIEDVNDKQWSLADDDQLFANAVLMPMTQKYFDTYGCPFKIKSTHDHGLAFSRFWCRASHEGDYQSIHDHQGIFTFVVWLKIPFDSEVESMVQPGFRPEAGDFVLVYPDTCGQLKKQNYKLNESMEGKIVFFPSDINHIVYPHFTTTEWRISIAGDIVLNSQELIDRTNKWFPDPKVQNV